MKKRQKGCEGAGEQERAGKRDGQIRDLDCRRESHLHILPCLTPLLFRHCSTILRSGPGVPAESHHQLPAVFARTERFVHTRGFSLILRWHVLYYVHETDMLLALSYSLCMSSPWDLPVLTSPSLLMHGLLHCF